jgi:ATP-binding cassette, subfamily B, bacterial
MDDIAIHEEEFQGSLNVGLWRRILRHGAPYKRLIVMLIVVAVSVSACEATLALLTRHVINAAAEDGVRAVIWPAAAAYFGLTVLVAVCIRLFIILGGRVATSISHDMRRDCFKKLQELSFSYYDHRPVGWLLSRVTSDCDRLSRLLGWGVLDIAWGTSFLLVIAVVMLVIQWKLALAVFIVLPPLGWVTRTFQRHMLVASRAARKINSMLTGSYNESLMGLRTTKTLVRESQNLAEFRDLSGQMFSASFRSSVLGAMFWPFIMFLGAVGAGAALWVGGGMVIQQAIDIGTLILFISLAQRFFEPVSELSRVFTDVLGAQAAAERVQGLLETVPDVLDSPEVLAAVARRRAEHPDGVPDDGLGPDGLPDRLGEIELRDVSFAYKEGRPVLDHFNLKVRPGESIALVGSTGGGKTTLVSLLARFYEPTGGQVLLDGVDYRRRSLGWLQSKLGVVLQSPHLFAGTVRENIAYGNLSASDDEIIAAARLACAHEFVMATEDGYAAQVGPGGNRLSTGQKQLIALARAILADPQLFIMDEATSSVDTETERLIQRGIERVMKGRTSFVIAHRLSTIRSADRILVIEKGSIVEQGSHLDLIRLRGKYYRLYTSQFAREREDELLRGAPATETA